jgi:dipeptidyl aminopeptidase/acylaminoacyl peptidase
LALVGAGGGPIRYLTEAFDENPGFIAWTKDGIYFNASQKTAAHLFRLDPESLKTVRVTSPDAFLGYGFSFSRDGKTMAFTTASATTLTEVCVSSLPFSPKKLTDMTAQVRDFVMGTREVVSWKSKDGAEIEGVLVKPADFDPARKYALLCVIHGGPTGVDRPLLGADTRYYPSDIWVARGALVLKVNYRGSAGYGEAFRKLNMKNLGVGDARDVLSGVDFLVGKGWVDPARVGCMGWSQGGYISAFLTTSSDRFKAISVGAGISNWATYYYNTDITPFTINYLGDDPIDDPEIYAKTSPMTYIKGAKTPTLIQHGEFDRRVPIPNAYELRQGLEDRGVPVEMAVYKGFGHGITKPKSMRAVMRHNLAWFGHHIFGDPAPDLALLGK